MRETLDSGSKGLGSSPGVLGRDCALTVPLPTLVRNWVPSNLDVSMTQTRPVLFVRTVFSMLHGLHDAVAFFAVVSNRRTGSEGGGGVQSRPAPVSRSFKFFRAKRC